MDLAGASVLVTGASSGIGAALAVALDEHAPVLGLVGRDEDRLNRTAAACSTGTVHQWAMDLGDLDDVDLGSSLINVTLAGGLASSFALGGAVSTNTTRNSTEAMITAAADVDAILLVIGSAQFDHRVRSPVEWAFFFYVLISIVKTSRGQVVFDLFWTNARLILIEGIKNGRSGLKVAPPLFIYDENGNYSAEVQRMFEP